MAKQGGGQRGEVVGSVIRARVTGTLVLTIHPPEGVLWNHQE